MSAEGERNGVSQRHARYHADYVRAQHPLSLSMDDRKWQARIRTELDNIRASLDWSLVQGNDSQLGLEMLAHFRRPRLIFLPSEALRWFELGAPLVDAELDVRVAAMVLTWYASTKVYSESPPDERIGFARRAVEAAERTGERAFVSNALNTLAICLLDAGRLEEAERVFEDAAAALHPEGGERIDRAELYADWARCDLRRGDVARAREHLNASLDSARAGSMVAASALVILAEVEFASGNSSARGA